MPIQKILYASATLAATYDADPTATTAGVSIPGPATGATVTVGYTRVSGQAGGQASHKLFTMSPDGLWGQMLGTDDTYNPQAGRASVADGIFYYTLAIPRLPPGAVRLAIRNAETGNAAHPGTIIASVSFA